MAAHRSFVVAASFWFRLHQVRTQTSRVFYRPAVVASGFGIVAPNILIFLEVGVCSKNRTASCFVICLRLRKLKLLQCLPVRKSLFWCLSFSNPKRPSSLSPPAGCFHISCSSETRPSLMMSEDGFQQVRSGRGVRSRSFERRTAAPGTPVPKQQKGSPQSASKSHRVGGGHPDIPSRGTLGHDASFSSHASSISPMPGGCVRTSRVGFGHLRNSTSHLNRFFSKVTLRPQTPWGR